MHMIQPLSFQSAPVNGNFRFASQNVTYDDPSSGTGVVGADDSPLQFQSAVAAQQAKNFASDDMSGGGMSSEQNGEPEKKGFLKKYFIPIVIALAVGVGAAFFVGQGRKQEVFKDVYKDHNKESGKLAVEEKLKESMKDCFIGKDKAYVRSSGQEVKIKTADGKEVSGVFVMRGKGNPYVHEQDGKYYLVQLRGKKAVLIDATHMAEKKGDTPLVKAEFADWFNSFTGATDGEEHKIPINFSEFLSSIAAAFKKPEKTAPVPKPKEEKDKAGKVEEEKEGEPKKTA